MTNTTTHLHNGDAVFIPLNKLKKSPRNARKTAHSAAAIEATAASIAAKGLLQNLVVEPERDTQGEPTGAYLVTIGEGRRLAQLLRVKRKEIKKTEPIRCVIDTANDPQEISLDENVTREAMHPADQFEAFRELSERQGKSAEDIAARFGVSAQTVRQRLRLAAVSPRLMQAYRDEELTLDQLTAFALVADTQRQEEVFDQLSWNRDPCLIRRELTRSHVRASDARARFVGMEAYEAAGGALLRDLFGSHDNAYFEDATLLDRLAAAKLEEAACAVRGEGWNWVEVHIDYPFGHGLRRCQLHAVALSETEEQEFDAAQAEYEALSASGDDADPALLRSLEATLERLDAKRKVFAPDDIARAGAFVTLDREGFLAVERGLLRPKEEADGEDSDPEEEADEGRRPSALADSLVRDLHAHRTLALRAALGGQPELALTAVTHAFAAQTFYPHAMAACLDIRPVSASLTVHAKAIAQAPGAQALAARHDAWATRLPQEAGQLWDYVAGLDATETMALLAHCASQCVAYAVPGDGRRQAVATTEQLATAVQLDMAHHWSATAESYLGRVTKAQVIAAVREAAGDASAERLHGLKKAALVASAEQLLHGTGWLPSPLRRQQAPEDQMGVAA